MGVHDDPLTIGEKLRAIRKRRKKSLAVIAGLAGISESYLSLLESGERPLDRLPLIVDLANALAIAPTELIALPVPAPANQHTDSNIEAVRRAMAGVTYGYPEGRVLQVDVLRTRLAELRAAPRRYADVGAALPALIRDVHTSLAAGRDVAELLELAVKMHVQTTHVWLRLAGANADLRRDAARLALDAARERGDTASLGVAAYGVAYAAVGSGMFDLAQTALDSLTLPPTTPDNSGLLGSLAITRAYVASLRGQTADVAGPMDAAAELAQRFGEATGDDRHGFAFGHTDVGLYRMALALEHGEPDRAVSVAQTMDPRQHPYRSRRAAYFVDKGRALAQVGDNDQAARVLRQAERVSPHHVHRNPIVREVVAGLVATARQDSVGSELRGLAYRAGLRV